MVSGVVHIAILDILIFKHEICLLFTAAFGLYPSVQLHRCTSINNNNVCKMVAVTRCQSQSNLRCWPCMKNGWSIPFSYLPARICPCAWCRRISWSRTIAPTWPTTKRFMRWDRTFDILTEPADQYLDSNIQSDSFKKARRHSTTGCFTERHTFLGEIALFCGAWPLQSTNKWPRIIWHWNACLTVALLLQVIQKAQPHRIVGRQSQVSWKRGAVRFTCSEDVIVDQSREALEALRSKHPPHPPDSSIPAL